MRLRGTQKVAIFICYSNQYYMHFTPCQCTLPSFVTAQTVNYDISIVHYAIPSATMKNIKCKTKSIMKKTLNQNYKKTEQFYVNFWCPFPLVPELIINQNARTKCRITVNAEKSQKMKVGVNITEVNSSNYSTMISPHTARKTYWVRAVLGSYTS